MSPNALTVDSGTVTQTLYGGFDGVWFYERMARQAGEPVTITMWTDPPSGPLYANGLDGVFYHALVTDLYENWVADGTPVTVTYDLTEIGEGMIDLVRYTADGHVQGGMLGVSTPGTITFTAVANVRATALVTATYLYNPPAGITITSAPISLTVGGESGLVTVTAPGLNGGIASNGTMVTWGTSLGSILTTTLTTGGVATTTLTAGDIAGTAVITATVDGFSDTTTVQFVGAGYRIYLPLVMKNH